jgi:hypothetical protein
VPGPDPLELPTVFGLFAYGPAPGIELIPYFLGLLAWLGLALGSILLSPITALLRLLRRGRRPTPPETASEPKTPSGPESQGEGHQDGV